jgi:Mrp family chromosome partitioning ATPase
VIVVRANYTEREAVRVIRERFAQDGTRVLGTILNDWNPHKSFHEYYKPNLFYRYYSKAE